jgi:hypothetical protein
MDKQCAPKRLAFTVAFTTLFSLPGCCVFYPRISNIVPNPGFEAGNTGFTSQYHYRTNDDDSGDYFIGGEPNQYNSNWPASIAPHTGHAMMIVDGAETPAKVAWATSKLRVRRFTTYTFSLSVTSLFADSPAVLRVSINGLPIGPDFLPGPNPGEWRQACFTWKSGGNTGAVVSLTDENTTYYGNDFAIDDVSFGTIHKCAAPSAGCASDPAVLPARPEHKTGPVLRPMMPPVL